MTYLEFLVIFLAVPISLLAVWRHRRQGALSGGSLNGWAQAILIHAGIAVAYTTPWDNFLVAKGVWAYDPDRVIGWRIGWVPLEEYMFFILQPILIGLWGACRWRELSGSVGSPEGNGRWRWLAVACILGLWAINLGLWRVVGSPWTYMGLIVAWGFPPLGLQVAFGGDLLWSYRNLLLRTWLPPALYLSAADALAIRLGIWRISRDWSTGWHVGGLPVEELVFFVLTSGLLANGMLLLLLPASRSRWLGMLRHRLGWRNRSSER